MSYLLFVDESGQDQRESPYEVLAGIAIEDRRLWPFICEVQRLETVHFGRRYAAGERELKATKLLKRKTFRHAAQTDLMTLPRRAAEAAACLNSGETASRSQLTALAQSKIAFCEAVLRTAGEFGVAAFASMVPRGAPRSSNNFLRKDYAFLFERYFYFLEDHREATGLIVFDELDRTQSHLLVDQMQRYFLETNRGLQRSRLVVPEPFFVHSDLTTGVQVADLLAYIVAWGLSVGSEPPAKRSELATLAGLVAELGYDSVRPRLGQANFRVFGLNVIPDLRPFDERELARQSDQ